MPFAVVSDVTRLSRTSLAASGTTAAQTVATISKHATPWTDYEAGDAARKGRLDML